MAYATAAVRFRAMRPRALRPVTGTALLALLALALAPACKQNPGPQGGNAPPVAPASSDTASIPANIPPVPPPSPGARIEDERNTIAVFREVAASTVFVTQRRLVVDRFWGQAVEVPAGSGSGFVWDADGHIVTNFQNKRLRFRTC